jgi:hypothetical protein
MDRSACQFQLSHLTKYYTFTMIHRQTEVTLDSQNLQCQPATTADKQMLGHNFRISQQTKNILSFDV